MGVRTPPPCEVWGGVLGWGPPWMFLHGGGLHVVALNIACGMWGVRTRGDPLRGHTVYHPWDLWVLGVGFGGPGFCGFCVAEVSPWPPPRMFLHGGGLHVMPDNIARRRWGVRTRGDPLRGPNVYHPWDLCVLGEGGPGFCCFLLLSGPAGPPPRMFLHGAGLHVMPDNIARGRWGVRTRGDPLRGPNVYHPWDLCGFWVRGGVFFFGAALRGPHPGTSRGLNVCTPQTKAGEQDGAIGLGGWRLHDAVIST